MTGPVFLLAAPATIFDGLQDKEQLPDDTAAFQTRFRPPMFMTLESNTYYRQFKRPPVKIPWRMQQCYLEFPHA